MQERHRGKATGFMTVEQRMSTPLPRFAINAGVDVSQDEFDRLEQLLLDFAQRDEPTVVNLRL